MWPFLAAPPARRNAVPSVLRRVSSRCHEDPDDRRRGRHSPRHSPQPREGRKDGRVRGGERGRPRRIRPTREQCGRTAPGPGRPPPGGHVDARPELRVRLRENQRLVARKVEQDTALPRPIVLTRKDPSRAPVRSWTSVVFAEDLFIAAGARRASSRQPHSRGSRSGSFRTPPRRPPARRSRARAIPGSRPGPLDRPRRARQISPARLSPLRREAGSLLPPFALSRRGGTSRRAATP